jgi:DNA-binding NarL/FixJ family response regulator
MSRVRVLLADDHRIVAEGLRRLLENEFDLVDLVEDGAALVDAAQRCEPDVIVTDIGMPVMNGIDAVIELRRTRPNIAVVFLTMHRDPAYLERARAAGGLGYVLKHSAAAELVTAVNEALAGREYVTPALLDAIEERSGRDSPHAGAQVTPRQREILQLIANGKLTKQIAAELAISDRTVEFHRLKLRQMLGARTTAELVRVALRFGLVDLPSEF